MDNTCGGFCLDPANTPFGLVSVPKDGLRGKDYSEIYTKGEAQKYGPLCPIGFTHNPTTEEKTVALIKANGRHAICPRNPWKWHNGRA